MIELYVIDTDFYKYIPLLLVVASTIIFIAVSGLIINRKHLILTFISIELGLLGFSLLFLIISLIKYSIVGFIVFFVLLTISAAEAAIALSLIVLYYRLTDSIMLNDICSLKG